MSTTLKSFTTANAVISKDLVVERDAWRANCTEAQTFRLFEVPEPGVENCTILYRAKLKSEGLTGRAYLEMWCRVRELGEFFSKGIAQTVSGSTDWCSREIPFFLKKGQQPDLVRLNLVVQAVGWIFKKPVAGRIWIKDVELVLA
jgi:hypothetical protein